MASGNNLHMLWPTKWMVRTGAVKSVLDNYTVLSSLMTEINEESYGDAGESSRDFDSH